MIEMLAQSMNDTDVQINSAIRANAIGKSIDGRRVLHNVSLAIGEGQFTALLGANGAGKSTLLKILATLTPPTEGNLHLFGHHVNRDSTNIRRRIGLIGHDSMLYRDLSAVENLLFFGKLYGVAHPLEQAQRLLDFVGLSSRGQDSVKTFSRGMVQRVSIARALMHDPDLLIADEPFNGLDSPSSRILESMLTDLCTMNKTIILATHDIHQCVALTDHVIVLRHGQVVIDCSVGEVDHQIILKEIEAP